MLDISLMLTVLLRGILRLLEAVKLSLITSACIIAVK